MNELRTRLIRPDLKTPIPNPSIILPQYLAERHSKTKPQAPYTRMAI